MTSCSICVWYFVRHEWADDPGLRELPGLPADARGEHQTEPEPVQQQLVRILSIVSTALLVLLLSFILNISSDLIYCLVSSIHDTSPELNQHDSLFLFRFVL